MGCCYVVNLLVIPKRGGKSERLFEYALPWPRKSEKEAQKGDGRGGREVVKIKTYVLDLEMIEDAAKIVNEVMKDNVRLNRIINNRTCGNAPLIARKIAERLHSETQQRFLGVHYCL